MKVCAGHGANRHEQIVHGRACCPLCVALLDLSEVSQGMDYAAVRSRADRADELLRLTGEAIDKAIPNDHEYASDPELLPSVVASIARLRMACLEDHGGAVPEALS